MPKRITITLPEPIYKGLGELSKLRDRVPAALAAEAVEGEVRRAAQEGRIPPLEPTPNTQVESEAFNLLDALLTKVTDGKRPTDTEITNAAMHTTISVDELKAMCDRLLKENGHAAAR